MGLLHKELTYRIRGCIYDVHNALGAGYSEEIYHIALGRRLKENGIAFQSKAGRYLEHRGRKVHKFVADLLVEDKVILELKSIQTDFHPLHQLQAISYLKCWQKELGLLVNFRLPQAAIKRIPFTEKNPTITEEYDAIIGIMREEDKPYLKKLKAALLTILEIHGLGYGASIYKALLMEELRYQNIPFKPKTIIPVAYDGAIIQNFNLKHPIIANKVLCYISALQEGVTNDISKVQTYLKDLDLNVALIAHFGKRKLEIIGVENPERQPKRIRWH